MRAAAAIVFLALTACATHDDAPLAPEAARPLVAPSTLGAPRTANQIVRGALGDREMTLNVVVTVQADTMTVVGLSAVGVRVFTIRYDGHDTKVENTLPIPPQLTPERLLSDLQLVYWPLNAIERPLHTAGWTVTQPAPGTRRLKRGDRLIAEVHYATTDPWQGRSWLVNLEYGYTLNIESRQM